MIRTRPQGVDLRAYRSRLLPLLTRFDAEIQAAQCALAAGKAKAAVLAAAVRDLHELHEREAEALRPTEQGQLDALAHGQALRHLLHLAHRRNEREAQWRAAEREVDEALKHCVDRDRRREAVRRMEERERKAHVTVLARRQAREADLAWLARKRSPAPCSPGEEA